MRDVKIQKLNDRHFAVYIDSELVYEGITQKSCVRYLRKGKHAYEKSHRVKPPHELVRGS